MLDQHRQTMNKSGSGLGLSISKKIVESLGGQITVTSEEKRWTEFKFTIKLSENELNNKESNNQNHEEEVGFANILLLYLIKKSNYNYSVDILSSQSWIYY